MVVCVSEIRGFSYEQHSQVRVSLLPLKDDYPKLYVHAFFQRYQNCSIHFALTLHIQKLEKETAISHWFLFRFSKFSWAVINHVHLLYNKSSSVTKNNNSGFCVSGERMVRNSTINMFCL